MVVWLCVRDRDFMYHTIDCLLNPNHADGVPRRWVRLVHRLAHTQGPYMSLLLCVLTVSCFAAFTVKA